MIHSAAQFTTFSPATTTGLVIEFAGSMFCDAPGTAALDARLGEQVCAPVDGAVTAVTSLSRACNRVVVAVSAVASIAAALGAGRTSHLVIDERRTAAR